MLLIRRRAVHALVFLALAHAGCARPAGDPNAIDWPDRGGGVATHAPELRLALPQRSMSARWLPDGTFSNGEAELAFFDVEGRPLGFADKELYPPTLPIGRSIALLDSIEFRAIAFAPTWAGSPDTTAWTLVLIEISNRVDRRARAELRVAVRSAEEGARYARRAGRALRNGRVLALYDDAEGPVLRDPRMPAAPAIARGANAEVGSPTPADHFAAGAHYGFLLEPGRSVWLRFALAPAGGVPLGTEPAFPRLNRGRIFEQTLKAYGVERGAGAGAGASGS